jgi:hypothetical protein
MEEPPFLDAAVSACDSSGGDGAFCVVGALFQHHFNLSLIILDEVVRKDSIFKHSLVAKSICI